MYFYLGFNYISATDVLNSSCDVAFHNSSRYVPDMTEIDIAKAPCAIEAGRKQKAVSDTYRLRKRLFVETVTTLDLDSVDSLREVAEQARRLLQERELS
jgi:hypothetical protein